MVPNASCSECAQYKPDMFQAVQLADPMRATE